VGCYPVATSTAARLIISLRSNRAILSPQIVQLKSQASNQPNPQSSPASNLCRLSASSYFTYPFSHHLSVLFLCRSFSASILCRLSASPYFTYPLFPICSFCFSTEVFLPRTCAVCRLHIILIILLVRFANLSSETMKVLFVKSSFNSI